MTKNFSLSCIIPVFNEGKRLEKTFEALRQFQCDANTLEVIFVNDGSTDATEEMLSDFLKTYPQGRLVTYTSNRGKGYAVTLGMQRATGDYRLFFDADMSTPISEFKKFMPVLEEGVDVVIGTRKTGDALLLERQPWLRETMGKVFTAMSNHLIGSTISDFTCGFKCFSRKSAAVIFATTRIERWAYDVEILLYARLNGFTIAEVPVVWKNDKNTSVRLFKDTVRSFIDLVRIRVFGKKWARTARSSII